MVTNGLVLAVQNKKETIILTHIWLQVCVATKCCKSPQLVFFILFIFDLIDSVHYKLSDVTF